MLTAILLWTILIAATVLLAAVASPIRLSCKAVYREEGDDTEFCAVAYYLHPLIIRAEYSSEEGQTRFFILGFEKRRGGINTKTKRDDGVNTESSINTNDINTDGINTDNINTSSINTNGINTDDVNTDSTNTNDINTDGVNINSINTNGVNTDGINTNGINTDGINTDSINTDGVNINNINTDNINTNSINTDAINTSDNINAKNDAETKEKKHSLMSRIKSRINDIKRRRVYKIISNKPLREKLLRWLKRSSVRVIRIVSFEKLKLHVRIGVRDPAKLGKIYGYFSATQSALSPRYYHIDLSMEPVFTKRCLDIDTELKIKTTLSTILWHLTMIAATFPYFRVRKVVKIKKLKD